MPFRIAWLHVRAFALTAIAVLLLVAAPAVHAQTPAPAAPAAAGLDAIKSGLDTIESEFKASHSNAVLTDLRARLAPLREDLRGRIETLGPVLAQVEGRLKQLGNAPAAGAPPEQPAVAAERARLVSRQGNLNDALKQAHLLVSRADDLAARVNERRRAIFANELFARTRSVFDPAFWREAAAGIPGELEGAEVLARAWRNHIRDKGSGAGATAAAVATFAALAVLGLLLGRWGRRGMALLATETRFGRVLAALMVFLQQALAVPIAVAAALVVLDAYGLVPPVFENLGLALVIAIAVASFGRGVAIALCAPDDPGRRMMPLDDIRAKLISLCAAWGSRALAAAIGLNILH